MIKDNTMNWDKFGHCVLCHTNMYIQQIIDSVPTWRLTGQYTEHEYVLSDKTKMRVAMCKKCKDSLTEEDNEKVMDCVVKGWDVATNNLVKDENKKDWDESKKKSYMDKYSKLSIVSSVETLKPSDKIKLKEVKK